MKPAHAAFMWPSVYRAERHACAHKPVAGPGVERGIGAVQRSLSDAVRLNRLVVEHPELAGGVGLGGGVGGLGGLGQVGQGRAMNGQHHRAAAQ